MTKEKFGKHFDKIVKGPVEEPEIIEEKVEEPKKVEAFGLCDRVKIFGDKDFNEFEITDKDREIEYVVTNVFANGNCLVAKDDRRFIMTPENMKKV